MTLRVHFPNPPEPPLFELFRGFLQEAVELTESGYEVLIAGRPKPEQMKGVKSLIIPFAGVPEETRTLVGELPGVTVHNLHHNAAATAEMAITLMLSAAKRVLPFDRAFRKNNWTARYELGGSITLNGRTAVIVGHGSVGKRVARACEGLEMKVKTLRSADQPSLPGLLPQAQVLILCVPLTPRTEGMIGKAELDRLPEGAVLVNMARGKVVEEEALYTALQSGKLGAAGLDVWYNYPKKKEGAVDTPPSKFPFHELDNVVMSPHRGGDAGTDDVERLRMKHLADLLNEAARTGEIGNRVDLKKGY